MKTISAGKFKDQCLRIMDAVAASGTPVVVTKRGRPVVRVTPCGQAVPAATILVGSILKEEGDPFGTGERWDADIP